MWWTQWKKAELRPYAGRLPRSPSRSEKRSLERPGEPSVMDAVKEAELRPYEGPFTQTRHVEARTACRALRGGRNGKKRSYGLVYPDPRSRSENRGLERHGEPCAGDSMERGGVTASQGPFTQTRYLGAGSSGKKRSCGFPRVVYPDPRSRNGKRIWNDMGRPSWNYGPTRVLGFSKTELAHFRNGIKRGPIGIRAKRTCRSGRPG